MDPMSPPPAKKPKKTLNACQRCRTRKIKCSGEDPCQRCTARDVECVFEDRPRKLVVSEDYLQELEQRAAGAALSSSNASPMRDRDERREHSSTASSTITPATLLPKEQRSSQLSIGDEYRRKGHSSSWSFSRRIRDLMHTTTGGQLHDEIPLRDGAFGVPWTLDPVDLSGLELPTEEYAEYLANTVAFTMSPLYRLFDKTAFLARLRQFYSGPAAGMIHSYDLWHIQMLVVFAFGHSILAREAGPHGPTGAAYIARAMKAMPDAHRLHQEPVLSMEILCMLALFMQAMDMRLAAYQYIGQALRIGLAQAMNRRFDAYFLRLPRQELQHRPDPQQEFQHRSDLWWTVYIIDRQLCSLVGVPSSLYDEEIAVSMPHVSAQRTQDSIFGLHVELSSQLGQILNVVYGLGVQRQLGAKFITALDSILHRLADTARLLNTKMRIDVQKPEDTISRPAATLHLLHHKCTILAIRPVLFFLLEKKLTTTNSSRNLADAVIGLLRVCLESAIQVLKIIEALRSQKLVDFLIPHDLDTMFAAAFVLVLVDIIKPASTEPWDLDSTYSLMDEMLSRGIVTAGPYKKDLMELDDCRRKLNIQRRPTIQLDGGLIPTNEAEAVVAIPTGQDLSNFAPMEQDLIWSGMGMSDAMLGVLDSATIQQAIDSLNFPFVTDDSGIEVDGSEWMWGNGLPDTLG